MTKLNIKNIACAGLMLLLSACNKQLDLKPTQSIETSQALLTAKDVQITLVGAYSNLAALRNNVESLYGGLVFLMPDLLGSAGQGIVDWTGTYQQLTEMTNQSITVNNSFVANLWLRAYQNINQLNYVISALDKVTVPADRDRIEGEAKFLRGMNYFDLVRLYGRAWNDGDPNTNLGVPIVLTPTTQIDATSNVQRATVAQVYAQILSDLTTAKTKLPATNAFYANKYAASALLSRVYMQKLDYPNAAAEANTVIGAGVYSLNGTYAAEFPFPGPVHVDNTSEDIFAVQITVPQGVNSLNEFYGGPTYGGRGDAAILPSFTAEFEKGDARGAFFYNDGGSLYSSKFQNQYGNVRIVRLAEMYLNRAEANLRIGTTSAIGDTPLNDVNRIRIRAGLSPLAVATVTNVLTERRHELAFEGGFFLHDAKRTMQNVGALEWNSPKLVFPVPQREIIANPNLKQNAGY